MQRHGGSPPPKFGRKSILSDQRQRAAALLQTPPPQSVGARGSAGVTFRFERGDGTLRHLTHRRLGPMAAAAEEEDRVLRAQCAASDEQTAGLFVIGVLTALGNNACFEWQRK